MSKSNMDNDIEQSVLSIFFPAFLEKFALLYVVAVISTGIICVIIGVSVFQIWVPCLLVLYVSTKHALKKVKVGPCRLRHRDVQFVILFAALIVIVLQYGLLAILLAYSDPWIYQNLGEDPGLSNTLFYLMVGIALIVYAVQFFAVKWEIRVQKIPVEQLGLRQFFTQSVAVIRSNTHLVFISLMSVTGVTVMFIVGYFFYQQYLGIQYFNRLAAAARYGQLYCPSADETLIKDNFTYAEAYPFSFCLGSQSKQDKTKMEILAKKGFLRTLKKAESGDAKAQFDISFAYDDGFGVSVDHQLAMHWLNKSVNQAYWDAQLKRAAQLATVYDASLDDATKELKHHLDAVVVARAEQGEPEALLYLVYKQFNIIAPEGAGMKELEKLLSMEYQPAYPLVAAAYDRAFLRDKAQVMRYLKKTIASHVVSILDKQAAYELLIELTTQRALEQDGNVMTAARTYRQQLTRLVQVTVGR